MRRVIATLFVAGLVALALFRTRRTLLARLLRLPPAEYPVTAEYDLALSLPDGTTLLADRFAPQSAGAFPTILVRTPYGRPSEQGLFGLPAQFVYELFAERGYNVVVQSVRGRFRSGGEFVPFVNEAADGRVTLEWLSRQPWFNGALGLWGASYVGYVQWAVAADAPPYVRAMVPMITSARFSRIFVHQGAFALDTALRWSYLVNVMEGAGGRFDLAAARRVADVNYGPQIATALDHLPIREADCAVLGRPIPYYRDWVDHLDGDDAYWQSIDHKAGLTRSTAPVHLIAGWYDLFLQAQLADYAALLAAGRAPYLTIGPYTHSSTAIVGTGLQEGLAWFAAYLKDDQSLLRRRPVRVYLMGAHEWHEMDYWPPPAHTTRHYLHAQGRLAATPPPHHTPFNRYWYNPAEPVPTVGGPLLNPQAGPHDNRALEARPDVLTFTSDPLADNVDVIGPVRLELYVRSSLSTADFFGRLCDVYPDGRSRNVCEGLFRVVPGAGEEQADGSLRIEIDMWATAQRFRRGHCIRLQVSSGSHPRWSRNLGTGDPVATGTRMAIAEQTIYHDAHHPSALVLPIVTEEHKNQPVFE